MRENKQTKREEEEEEEREARVQEEKIASCKMQFERVKKVASREFQLFVRLKCDSKRQRKTRRHREEFARKTRVNLEKIQNESFYFKYNRIKKLEQINKINRLPKFRPIDLTFWPSQSKTIVKLLQACILTSLSLFLILVNIPATFASLGTTNNLVDKYNGQIKHSTTTATTTRVADNIQSYPWHRHLEIRAQEGTRPDGFRSISLMNNKNDDYLHQQQIVRLNNFRETGRLQDNNNNNKNNKFANRDDRWWQSMILFGSNGLSFYDESSDKRRASSHEGRRLARFVLNNHAPQSTDGTQVTDENQLGNNEHSRTTNSENSKQQQDGELSGDDSLDQVNTNAGNQFDCDHSSSSLSSSSLDGSELNSEPNGPNGSVQNDGGHSVDDPNNTTHCDSLEDIIAARPSQTIGLLFGINYLIIFILGLLGNVITLYVLACKGKKRSAQDMLIGNLACSDIMLCVFAVPITPKYLIRDGHWTLGPALCKVVSFAQSTSVYMSTYSLICIGYIRYRLIVHPLENAMSKRAALLYCLGTWMISLVVTVPYMLQVRLAPEHCPIKFCDEAWEKPYLRFIFSLFTALFQFLIPLGSVGFFNKKIYSRLDGRLAHSDAAETTSVNQQHHNYAHQNLNSNPSKCNSNNNNNNNDDDDDKKQKLTTGVTVDLHLNHHHYQPPSLNPKQRQQHDENLTTGGENCGSLDRGNNHHFQHHKANNKHHNRDHHHHHLPYLHRHAHHSKSTGGSSGVMAIKEHRQREKEKRMRKANNRLIFVVVIFAHSWLPLNLFNMIQDYFEEMAHWKYLTNTFLVVHQIACSSVIWNPILYAWMSETYRQELRCALPKFIAKKFSSCLSEPAQATTTGGGASCHGPASTSAITMNYNNNNNQEQTNGKNDRFFTGKRFTHLMSRGGGGGRTAGAAHDVLHDINKANNHHLPIRRESQTIDLATTLTTTPKSKSIDQIAESCPEQSDEIKSLSGLSEIILTENKKNLNDLD